MTRVSPVEDVTELGAKFTLVGCCKNTNALVSNAVKALADEIARESSGQTHLKAARRCRD